VTTTTTTTTTTATVATDAHEWDDVCTRVDVYAASQRTPGAAYGKKKKKTTTTTMTKKEEYEGDEEKKTYEWIEPGTMRDRGRPSLITTGVRSADQYDLVAPHCLPPAVHGSSVLWENLLKLSTRARTRADIVFR